MSTFLKKAITLFTREERAMDPATTHALDLILLELAKMEDAVRVDMCAPTESVPLTVEQFLNRVSILSRDFLFNLEIVATDHHSAWSYLFGESLTTEFLRKSRHRILRERRELV